MTDLKKNVLITFTEEEFLVFTNTCVPLMMSNPMINLSVLKLSKDEKNNLISAIKKMAVYEDKLKSSLERDN